ncbi:Fur family transcriptional regulator [Thauera sinica]|nr:Fur family transcriptional regulator [Thauera sp. K11]ATE62238.1 transcriptional repressor [Thauera sp. K11]
MNAYSFADAVACLRNAGVAVTRPRIEIARIMFSRPVHLTAEQVFERVRTASPETSRATVYNTLNFFSEKKLVRKLLVTPQHVIFDSTPTPHFHLFDADTGEISDLDPQDLKVVGQPKLPEGVELEEVDVIVRVRSRKS